MVNKNSVETGRIFFMEGSKQVLVKSNDFSVNKHVYPQDGTTPSFFYDSRSYLLVLLIDVSEFLWEGDNNFKKLTSGPI